MKTTIHSYVVCTDPDGDRYLICRDATGVVHIDMYEGGEDDALEMDTTAIRRSAPYQCRPDESDAVMASMLSGYPVTSSWTRPA